MDGISHGEMDGISQGEMSGIGQEEMDGICQGEMDRISQGYVRGYSAGSRRDEWCFLWFVFYLSVLVFEIEYSVIHYANGCITPLPDRYHSPLRAPAPLPLTYP
jgi:hypothetical protein